MYQIFMHKDISFQKIPSMLFAPALNILENMVPVPCVYFSCLIIKIVGTFFSHFRVCT